MRTPFGRVAPLLVFAGFASLPARRAFAGDPPVAPLAPVAPVATRPSDLPPGVVARVRGRDLTEADFEARLVERMREELTDPQSSALGVFQIKVEEMVVAQEAAKLGIRVSTEDYDREYGRQDFAVRGRFGGTKTLADLIREQEMTPQDFRARIEDWLRKERIAEHYLPSLAKDPAARVAQVEVVVQQLIKKAIIEKDGMPVGVVAKVSGEPMTVAAFGAALRVRLAKTEVRRHLQEICITLLLDQEGLDFKTTAVDQELELDRPLWLRMRAEALTPEKRELPFEGFLQIRYNASMEDLHKSPYRRGLFALRRRLREGVTEDDVLKAWTRGSQSVYGPSLVVTDIMVSFESSKAVAAPVKRRTPEEARRLVADFARRLAANEPLKTLETEIKSRGDRSMLVEHRAVMSSGNDLLVYEAALGLKDNAWGAPFETQSEVHLVRREAYRPPPKFEDVRAVVSQHLVDERAQLWIQDRMRDDVVLK